MDVKSVIDTRRKGEPDLVLFILIFVLAGIGIAMSYSASAVYAINTFGDSFFFLKRQLLWFFVGFLALIIFQEIDYRIFLKHTKVMLLGAFVLLIAVVIPGIGHTVKGSVRWFTMGSFSMQPSEFVKVVMVIYLAKVFSSESKENQVAQLMIPMAIVGGMFVLIMLQPDFGTAVDMLIVSVVILFVSGFPVLYLLLLFILSVPMFYLLIYQVPYRRLRLNAYLDPWRFRFNEGYHIIQSFIAFKKGGFLGVGLGYGTQKIRRLPEPHTDFVFAVIAEEAGFIGVLLIVALYVAFFWRGILIAVKAPDDSGRLLAVGLSLMITVQAFINMAVVSGSLPTTGIPLPFISYGGSSLLSTMIAAGILLNISRYKEVAYDGVHIGEEVWL